MNKNKPKKKVLKEKCPNLESGTLVYLIRRGYHPGDKTGMNRQIAVFDCYSNSKNNGAFWVKESIKFSPESFFNRKEIPTLSVGGREKIPNDVLGFYIGKEEIVRQLRNEHLKLYADIAEKL